MPRPSDMQITGFYDQDPRATSPLDGAILILYRPDDPLIAPLEGSQPDKAGFWSIWRSFDADDPKKEFDAPWDPDLTASGWEIYESRISQDVERLPEGVYSVRIYSSKTSNGTGWQSTPLQRTRPLDEVQKRRIKELIDNTDGAYDAGSSSVAKDYAGWNPQVFSGDADDY
jgi:hypothetical protein